MDVRELPPVLPFHFFDLRLKSGKVPSYADLLDEEGFSEIEILLKEEGIDLNIRVEKGFEKAFFPEVEKGDGLEFFVDTRGIRDVLIVHKYCHHFVFLPKEIDGISGAEVTRFKTNETRELARRELLKVTTDLSKNRYTMHIHIPKEALFGYDIEEYPLLRFAYIVHRYGNEPNHFPKSNKEYNLKDQPSLWAELEG